MGGADGAHWPPTGLPLATHPPVGPPSPPEALPTSPPTAHLLAYPLSPPPRTHYSPARLPFPHLPAFRYERSANHSGVGAGHLDWGGASFHKMARCSATAPVVSSPPPAATQQHLHLAGEAGPAGALGLTGRGASEDQPGAAVSAHWAEPAAGGCGRNRAGGCVGLLPTVPPGALTGSHVHPATGYRQQGGVRWADILVSSDMLGSKLAPGDTGLELPRDTTGALNIGIMFFRYSPRTLTFVNRWLDVINADDKVSSCSSGCPAQRQQEPSVLSGSERHRTHTLAVGTSGCSPSPLTITVTAMHLPAGCFAAKSSWPEAGHLSMGLKLPGLQVGDQVMVLEPLNYDCVPAGTLATCGVGSERLQRTGQGGLGPHHKGTPPSAQ
ncbi:uncharacterized protein HaLaN_20673 [Haematococcus lacustris]|uniref:Uncharacterized protein n=1 Tax=Haematococcus lacustris TaxID=44745 RepID=A0A6A0A1U9_HAELA|nr:uncharacterized protein HaLaN_20673 [Haematococcus lacustris]